jgi:hypothetical protein
MNENLTKLTEYDILELYIRCVEVFVERCTRMELESDRAFELGKKLWEESIKTLGEYRKEHSGSSDFKR